MVKFAPIRMFKVNQYNFPIIIVDSLSMNHHDELKVKVNVVGITLVILFIYFVYSLQICSPS